MPRVQEVIIAEEQRGNGVQESPYRSVVVVYTKEGELIAQADFWSDFTMENMLEFGKAVRESPGELVFEVFKRLHNRHY